MASRYDSVASDALRVTSSRGRQVESDVALQRSAEVTLQLRMALEVRDWDGIQGAVQEALVSARVLARLRAFAWAGGVTDPAVARCRCAVISPRKSRTRAAAWTRAAR